MKNRKALCLCLALVFSLSAGAEESSSLEGFTFPAGDLAGDLASPVVYGIPNEWVPPPPPEHALWGELPGNCDHSVLRAVSFVGILSGLALSAGGIGLFFTAAGNGLDQRAMHRDLTIALSGTLISSFFTILRDVTVSPSKE